MQLPKEHLTKFAELNRFINCRLKEAERSGDKVSG
jgi:hypothetical protein